MSQENCILTTKDFTIVEVMRERCIDADDPMRPLLDRKLKTAQVVFREDALPTLATISSRIVYTINNGDTDTRILSHGVMNTPTGLYLPISSLRGLALLGLSEGQECSYLNRNGFEEKVQLTAVQYQPEAARREMVAAARLCTPQHRRANFRVISGYGAFSGLGRDRDGPDDSGPSAA